MNPLGDRSLIHVIEPTLQDYAGHCYGLVRSFCDAANREVKLWGGRGSAALAFGEVDSVSHFDRRLRLIQLLMLLHRLLRKPQPVLIMTARRSDLALARLAARGRIPAGRLFLYFHWFRESPSRLAYLTRAARAQPHIGILATTPTVAEIFSRAGFANVVLLPYPLTATRPHEDTGGSGFSHLLYAGAARNDKGFTLVVDLVEHLAREHSAVPIAIQISADHYGKYDSETRSDISRLAQIDYPRLRILRHTLQPAEYAELFRGAICLQPYDRSAFRDRVSGVTMDALTYGCPVIVPADTWMARLIHPQSAGIELDKMNVETLASAAQYLIANYAAYQLRAATAGKLLRQRSWEPFLKLLR